MSSAKRQWASARPRRGSFKRARDIVSTEGYVLGGSQRIVATGDDVGADPLYTDPPTAYLCYLPSFAQAFIAARYPDLAPGVDYDVFRFPTINPDHEGAVTVGADIPVMVSDTPAARSFMTYLASARAQETWIKRGGFISVNPSVSATGLVGDDARPCQGSEPGGLAPRQAHRRQLAIDAPARGGRGFTKARTATPEGVVVARA